MAILRFASIVCLVAMTTVTPSWSQTPNYAVPPPCDKSNMPTIEKLDLDKFFGGFIAGVWYKKYSTMDVVDDSYTGYQVNFKYEYDEDGNVTMSQDVIKVFDSNETCEVDAKRRCRLEGATCTEIDFPTFFTIIAINYNIRDAAFAAWSETTVGNVTYPIFSIYVSDPIDDPDISAITPQIRQFCGDKATDVHSDFYGVTVPFTNIPACLIPDCTLFGCP